MKYLFFISFMMFMVINIMAYQPMTIDGYRWNIVYFDGDDGDNITKYTTRAEFIDGDSVINGVVYKKLWEANSLNLSSRNLLALVREDIQEQKIFAYNTQSEVLLYDLGVKIGDTIKVMDLAYLDFNSKLEEPFYHLVVDNIDTITDKTYGLLKQITYSNVDTNHGKRTMTICERYGSLTGWSTTPFSLIVGSSRGKMICAFDENGDVVFKQKYTIKGYGEVKDCYINAEINTNVDAPKKEESVYYNSQDKTLHVDFEEDEKIEIYNTMGKRVMRKRIDENCKSINCNLNAGVYIVTVKNSNTQTKIVVK